MCLLVMAAWHRNSLAYAICPSCPPCPSCAAALQRERQRSAALERQLALQSQQGEERELALEARMHTLQRQLLAAAARRVGVGGEQGRGSEGKGSPASLKVGRA